jgi:hypothetical protein
MMQVKLYPIPVLAELNSSSNIFTRLRELKYPVCPKMSSLV